MLRKLSITVTLLIASHTIYADNIYCPQTIYCATSKLSDCTMNEPYTHNFWTFLDYDPVPAQETYEFVYAGVAFDFAGVCQYQNRDTGVSFDIHSAQQAVTQTSTPGQGSWYPDQSGQFILKCDGTAPECNFLPKS